MAQRDGSPVVLTEELLSRIAQAATKNPQAVSRVVGQIANQLDTSVDDVARAVRDAASVVGGAALTIAKAAGSAVDSAISAGALAGPAVPTTAAAAAGASTGSSGGGIVSWFTGMSVAAQVATVIGAVVLTSAVAQGFSAPDIPVGVTDGYRAIGVQADGQVRIVSVRGTVALDAGIAPCRFRHGGNDCDSTADIVELDSTVHATAAKATEALCEMLDGPRFAPALSDGWSVPYDGRNVTLDDWGEVDFEVCDAVLGG